jgi:hypothetical protein
MRMIGCDLHAAQQTIAMLDGETGEIVERTLTHNGTTVGTSMPTCRLRSWWALKPRDRWDGFCD